MTLREKLEALKHDAPNHPRGIGFNEGVDAALRGTCQHLAEQQQKLREVHRAIADEVRRLRNEVRLTQLMDAQEEMTEGYARRHLASLGALGHWERILCLLDTMIDQPKQGDQP